MPVLRKPSQEVPVDDLTAIKAARLLMTEQRETPDQLLLLAIAIQGRVANSRQAALDARLCAVENLLARIALQSGVPVEEINRLQSGTGEEIINRG